MNIQLLRKITTICLLFISCLRMQTSFAAQVPLVLQSKLTHLLQQLDKAEVLTPELYTESQDLIKHLQRFDANNEIQRIQKRLIDLTPMQVPSSEEEEKKLKQQQGKVSATQNVMDYLKLHGAAAAQRVRSFAPHMVGPLTCLGVAAGIGITIYPFATVEPDKKDINLKQCVSIFLGPLLTIASLTLTSYMRFAVFDNIQAGNIEKVRHALDTHLVGVNTRASNNIPPRTGDNDNTLLMHAARYGQADVTKLLLERGADVSLKDRNGRDALDYTQFASTDSPELRKGKLAVRAAILEHKLKKKEQARLRGLYEPAETVAAEAIDALHTSIYGTQGIAQAQEISKIVASYLTPEYVVTARKQYKKPAYKKGDTEAEKKASSHEKQD